MITKQLYHTTGFTVTPDYNSIHPGAHNVCVVLMCQAGVELVKTFLYYRPLNFAALTLGSRSFQCVVKRYTIRCPSNLVL